MSYRHVIAVLIFTFWVNDAIAGHPLSWGIVEEGNECALVGFTENIREYTRPYWISIFQYKLSTPRSERTIDLRKQGQLKLSVYAPLAGGLELEPVIGMVLHANEEKVVMGYRKPSSDSLPLEFATTSEFYPSLESVLRGESFVLEYETESTTEKDQISLSGLDEGFEVLRNCVVSP